MKQKKDDFYHCDKILKKGCRFNLVYGKRSNGKTFDCLVQGIKRYYETGERMAYIRRWDTDFKGLNGTQLFAAINSLGLVEEITDGYYKGVHYYGERWFLYTTDENGEKLLEEMPFCYGLALNTMEHTKSISYPNVKWIVFDEFISRGRYLPNEFSIFMNLLSTIIRRNDGAIIMMLGNTVSKNCPYFKEMGIVNFKKMKPGQIDVYKYGNSDLRVAVEYTPSNQKSDSDVYFAFDNPRLKMITEGAWEIDIYPHIDFSVKKENILYAYYIEYDDETLKCNIVLQDDMYFTYVHPWGTIKDYENQTVFSPNSKPYARHYTKINKPVDTLTRRIAEFYKKDKVFFSDNETGEKMRNYLLWCGKSV